MDTARIWRTAEGRIRLGWRLLLFVVLLMAVAVTTTLLVPPVLPWGSLPGLLGALVAGWTVLRLDGRSPRALGFPLERAAARGVAAGLVLGVGVALLAVALIALAGGLRWTGDAGGPSDWLAAGATTLWMLAIPAAAEEAMLRGYPLQALAEAWGPGWALAVTAAAFSLLHLANPEVGWLGLANIAAAGLFLGALYLRTASLWWATGAHLGWNWAQAFLADLPVSGYQLLDVPLLDAVPSGPAWVSGGAFGPEGSALATGAVLAAAVWAWHTPRLAHVRRAVPMAGAGPSPESR